MMKKKNYVSPKIEIADYSVSEVLANDNIISDPWGFEDEEE